MKLSSGAATGDRVMKYTPHSRRKTQAASFGESGTSTHGVDVIIKRLPQALQARVCEWSELDAEERTRLQADIEAAGAPTFEVAKLAICALVTPPWFGVLLILCCWHL